MSTRFSRTVWLAVLLAVPGAGASGPAGAAPPVSAAPLRTSLDARSTYTGEDANVAFARSKAAGASIARLIVSWAAVAPAGDEPPASFDATDPDDPNYRWSSADSQVSGAVAAGLEPLVDVYEAPPWAAGPPTGRPEDGPNQPRPQELAKFFTALAKRFSGSFRGLPRVRYWEVWNEPNVSQYLMPTATSPSWYRAMVNASAAAIHAVRADNLVVAGSQSPFGHEQGEVPGLEVMAPMEFMRKMLCMSAGARPRPTCRQRSTFDVWSHHPYTSGGPTHSAYRADDVSLGDLPEMKRLLDAAVKAGHVRSPRAVQFWVTEFSWDTAPPDPKGVPVALHARWVSEALYRSWLSGVSVFSWFFLRDQPFAGVQYCQCGLYFRGRTLLTDRPKPALQAFRFPFVAFAQPDATVSVWGRTPGSDSRLVVIERSAGGGWQRVGEVRSNRYGIFQGVFPSASRVGYVRARIAGGGTGDTARPFGLRVPPDRSICPFGTC